jgi:hypothetical protein
MTDHECPGWLCDTCMRQERRAALKGGLWFDVLEHEPCPLCGKRVLAANLCDHNPDGLCRPCCMGHHPRPCPQCAGTGQWQPGVFAGTRNYDPRLVRCDDCGGTGTLNLKDVSA